MHEHHVAVTRSARYFALGARERAREAWIVCHGYGQLAARFLERFRDLDDGTRYLIAPEGLSRFYLTEQPSERRVGASWMTREDRLREISDYVRYLDAVHEHAIGPGLTSIPVVALGFSQGSATACRWAALGSSHIDRLVVWGGEVPPDLELGAAPVAARLRTMRLTLVYGSRDEFFTAKVVRETEARLRDHGVVYELVPFDGGHEIDPPTLARLAAR